jgi:hypothetical protein
MSATKTVQSIVDMAMKDARQAEEIMNESGEESTVLRTLIEDAFSLAAAGQKVLTSDTLEEYSPAEAMVIVALEAMSLARAEEKATSKIYAKRGKYLN